jgi:hypothetical protein
MAREPDVHSVDGRSSDDYENIKMLRAQQNTQALHKVISRLYNNPEELKWIISQAFSSTTDMMTWFRKIDDYTNSKILIPGGRGQAYTDPYQDPVFINDLRNTLMKEWAELSKGFDPTSRVAMKDFMTTGFRFPYNMINPEFFISWATKGKLLILTGEKDSGKSDWSCELARIAIASKRYKVLSNIELISDVEGYIYCKLFSSMVKHICDAKLSGQQTIVVIDEAGLDFASYEAATKESKEFDKFAKLTRKFATNQVFIIQYEHQVPWTLKKHNAAWMHKFDTRHEMKFEINTGPNRGFNQIISGIPPTSMPFNTSHISGMSMDLSVREMLDFLDTLPPKVNQFEHLARFVEERKNKHIKKEVSTAEKKEMMERLAASGEVDPTTLSKAFGVSRGTVSKWINKD